MRGLKKGEVKSEDIPRRFRVIHQIPAQEMSVIRISGAFHRDSPPGEIIRFVTAREGRLK